MNVSSVQEINVLGILSKESVLMLLLSWLVLTARPLHWLLNSR